MAKSGEGTKKNRFMLLNLIGENRHFGQDPRSRASFREPNSHTMDEMQQLRDDMKQAMLDRFGFWVNEPLLKMCDALSMFDKDSGPKVVFMPDIVRDGIIIVPPDKDISGDLSPESEKNRLRGYVLFLKGGGHAFIGAYAAAALRGREDVEVSILTEIFERDRSDLVDWYMRENLERIGANPIDSSLTFVEPGNKSSINIVVEQKGSTPIITGRQPSLDINELEEDERARALKAMQDADVVAALSVKAPSFKQTIQLIIDGKLKVNELFSDCTSGDNVAANYEVLDVLRMHDSQGRSPITLLSINSHEARLYAALLRIEDKGQRQKLVEMAGAGDKKGAESVIEMHNMKDGFQDAVFLNERLGIPLLYHAADGSCIIDATGERSTLFVPSVKLRKLPDNFVGAGDTLCGGMALALAVKRKLDDPKTNAPKDMRFSMEECLIIANLVTCYRLERIAELSGKGKVMEWHASVGSIDQLFDWAKNLEFSEVTSVPSSEILKLGAVDLERLAEGDDSDEYTCRRTEYMWESRISTMTSVYLRKRMKEGIPFDELAKKICGFVVLPRRATWGSLSFLNNLRFIPIPEEEASRIIDSLLNEIRLTPRMHDANYRAVGRIIRILGPQAVDKLLTSIRIADSPDLYRPYKLTELIRIAGKIGDSFNTQLEKFIKKFEIMLMLHPWKERALENIISAAEATGDWGTARALARTLPTNLLWVPPSDEAPSVSVARAVERIARRTGDADIEVAQILYEAEVSQSSTHNAFNLFSLDQLIGGYSYSLFPETASKALEAVRENLAANGVVFKPNMLGYGVRFDRIENEPILALMKVISEYSICKRSREAASALEELRTKLQTLIACDQSRRDGIYSQYLTGDQEGWSVMDHAYLELFADRECAFEMDGQASRVLKENSLDVMPERDMHDMRQKVAVLQNIQRKLITMNPKVQEAITKMRV